MAVGTILTYTDTAGVTHTLELLPSGSQNAARVESIPSPYTDPSLYRQIEDDPEILPGEVSKRTYTVNIRGTDSYRSTVITTHDEQSTDSEIP